MNRSWNCENQCHASILYSSTLRPVNIYSSKVLHQIDWCVHFRFYGLSERWPLHFFGSFSRLYFCSRPPVKWVLFVFIFYTSFAPLLCQSTLYTTEWSFFNPYFRHIDLGDFGNFDREGDLYFISLFFSSSDDECRASANIPVRGKSGVAFSTWLARDKLSS